MDIDWARRCCLSFPQVTETVQWECLVFKIGGKIFALVALEPQATCISFKCSPEDFADLTERPDIVPAPYLARAQWIALEREDALPAAELKRLLRQAYELVRAKLPKKVQAQSGARRKTAL
jgi:predicted DNA-binding protein (MmcQ/YjbR family)